MKKMKKIIAAFMAMAMLLCMIPVTVSAANEPTELYVGEVNKVKDNLIEELRVNGPRVRVESVREENSFYEITFEDGVGYVLTFYNLYPMSSVLPKKCGLYCDGDLTVRLDVTDDFMRKYPNQNANIVFDMNDYFEDPKNEGSELDTTGYNGWVVDGTLTIECTNKVADKAVLNVDGSFVRESKGSTGIKAKNILLNNVQINVNGGFIGIDAEDTIGMINSTLNANMDYRLRNGSERLFKYSIRTMNLLEAISAISEKGDISLKAYWGSGEGGINPNDKNDNSGMERDPHAYVYDYGFYVEKNINGEKSKSLRWREAFQMFYNPDMIPGCVYIANPAGIDTRRITGKQYKFNWVHISGNSASIHRPTTSAGVILEERLVCGSAYYIMDTCRVIGTLKWWQVVLYYLSFDWATA